MDSRILNGGLAMAFFALAALPMALIAIVILVLDGKPIIFHQKRVGRRGKLFIIYKFRTMRNSQETWVGKWLRQTHLDELPQLWNVIKGDMNIVGPRPLIPQEVNSHSLRHLVRPGLTGLLQLRIDGRQLHGRAGERLEIAYIQKRSIGLDIIILLKTPLAIFRRQGV